MDSLRVLQCSTSAQYQYHLRKQLEFPLQCRSNFLKPRISHSFRNLGFLNRRILCGVSSVLTREEEKKMGTRTGNGKVKLSILLKHQVKFGEHVVMLGSTKELGSWKKNVPMNWTENGWVCKLELRGDESIEYKFVIVKRDKSMTWEGANNRVLKLPKGGSFGVVCLWNATGEAVDLLPLDSEKDEVEFDHMDEIGSADVDSASVLEVQASPFVEQWQGRSVSFMRSNEHRNQETERRWDTSGLEGLPLKLVEGDRKARNWWQKLSPIPEKCHANIPGRSEESENKVKFSVKE